MQVSVNLKNLLAGGWPAEPAAQQRLAQTLVDNVINLCQSGRGPQLHTWLQQLPPPVRNGNPLLQFTEASCLLHIGHYEAARQIARQLWAAVAGNHNAAPSRHDNARCTPDRFTAAVAVLAVHCAITTGCYAESLALIAESERICTFTLNQQVRLLTHACTAEYFLGRHARALSLGQQLVAHADAEPYAHTEALAYVAAMHADLGQFFKAHDLLRQAEAALSRFPHVGLEYLVLAVQAHVRIAKNDPIAALRLTERALPLAARADQAIARAVLLLLHARALGLLGRWAEAAAALRELDGRTMTHWHRIRLETAWALHDANTGNGDLALQRIPAILAELNRDAPPGETWTLLELAEAADMADSPALSDLLDQLHKLVPPVHVGCRARLAWLTTKHAWRSGGAFSEPLAEFVTTCEQHQLTGILGRAAREAPHIFLDGLQSGVASPLYGAALPPLNDEQMQHLVTLVTNPHRPATVRQLVWHYLTRYPEHEATLLAATTLVHADATGLGSAARRLLQSVQHQHQASALALLQFKTFGHFELTYRGRPSTVPWRRKAQVLFTLLMAQHPCPLPRLTIQELLWPDLRPQAAANNLRVVTHGLRRTLAGLFAGVGDGVEACCPTEIPLQVVSTSDTLSLCGAEAVQWDARDFAAYVATARQCVASVDPTGAIGAYTHALALYRGPYLSDGLFDKSFALDREHYAHLAYEATVELAALHLDDGDLLQALVHAEQAVETDPLDEIAHQLVIRAQAALGYPHRAAAAFARFQAWATEAGITPNGSTDRLVQELLHG